MSELKYPIGCRITWNEEEFVVLENHDDIYGTVRQGNDVISNFYFNYQGEKAILIG